MSNLNVAEVFRRINGSNDSAISGDDMKTFAERAGVGRGAFGSIKVRTVVKEFLKNFDNNGTGDVDMVEFRRNIRKFTDMAGLDMGLFDAADNNPRNGRAPYGELKPALERRLEEDGANDPNTYADVGTKLALAGGGRGEEIYREDLQTLLDDIRNPAVIDQIREKLWDLMNGLFPAPSRTALCTEEGAGALVPSSDG